MHNHMSKVGETPTTGAQPIGSKSQPLRGVGGGGEEWTKRTPEQGGGGGHKGKKQSEPAR